MGEEPIIFRFLRRWFLPRTQSTGREYLYKTPPEKCYCQKCGAEIDMRRYGFYGKHCYEVPCPICGGRMWRRKWW